MTSRSNLDQIYVERIWGQAVWPCGKWLWLNSCASWVRIPASPTYWRKIGGKRSSGGRRWVEERVFRRHNYWLHAPHLYLKKQMKNEITTTTTIERIWNDFRAKI